MEPQDSGLPSQTLDVCKTLDVRQATVDDLEAINHIYNYYVLESTATYAVEPESMENRKSWFLNHTSRHPVIVAAFSGRVLGWGSLSQYHSRCAYSQTVENSIYVHHEWHRRGIGRRLLQALISLACIHRHHTIVALISADQTASIALHQSLGFQVAGRLREVGRKFDRWLDVVHMQRMIEGVSLT